MIEAMACGTPVIAFRYGAVPEVVVDGKTGSICDSTEEMAACLNRITEIDRHACRQHVERQFSVQAMTDGYERVYDRVLASTRPTFRALPRRFMRPGWRVTARRNTA